MTDREKLIEAMARAICVSQRMNEDDALGGWIHWREEATQALAAIAEQGYAVVPRGGPDDLAADACGFQQAKICFDRGDWDGWKRAFYRAMVGGNDVAHTEATCAV